MKKVIVIYGLPCTGKTTVCNFLSAKLSADQVYTDRIWKDVFPYPKYTADESHAVFSNLLHLVRDKIQKNSPAIVVEGVFASKDRLESLKSLAISNSYQFLTILLFADADILKSRNHNRGQQEGDMKDEVIDKLKNKFNSREFCDLAINTGIVSEEKTKIIASSII